MQRLLRKFDPAKALLPAPVPLDAAARTGTNVIYIGSTTPAKHEALIVLRERGLHLDALRVRAFPFSDAVFDFIARHDKVFVVAQNRDAQLRSMLINEGGVDPAKLPSILHFDGTPITARFIVAAISERMEAAPKSTSDTARMVEATE